MSKRKVVLVIFFMLIFALTLLTGCSDNGQGLLHESYTYEVLGDFILSLPERYATPAEVTVKYLGKIDLENQAIDFSFTLVQQEQETTQEIARLLYQDEVLYLKIDEIIKLAQVIGEPETSHKLKKIFGDAEYLSLTKNEYLQSLDQTDELPLPKLDPQSFAHSTPHQMQQKILSALQNAKPSAWEITETEAVELMTNILEYLINYLTDIEEYSLSLTNAKGQIKKAASFTVTIPTNVLTYSDYLAKVTKTLTIQIDTNTYTFATAEDKSQGELTVKNLQNHTYLPLRKTAKIFDTKVGWDQTKKQAYVLRNHQKIAVPGMMSDGRTYIKTRDLTKLGYQVNWDENTRTVILSTSFLAIFAN